MAVSARHEFWIWTACIVVFLVMSIALLAALGVAQGGWWGLVPAVWIAAGLGVAAWVKKVRQDAVDA